MAIEFELKNKSKPIDEIPDELHTIPLESPNSRPKWSGYFKIVKPTPELVKQTDSQTIGDQGTYNNSTWFQRLVQGSASRLTRYREYNLMDQDVEIARALDTIAEEITGNSTGTNEPINLEITTPIASSVAGDIPSSVEVLTLRTALRRWGFVHDFENKLFKIARVLVKYGDCFFKKKNPFEKWEYIPSEEVIAAVVDKDDVTKVLYWQVKTNIRKSKASYGTPIAGHNDAETEYVPNDQMVRFTLCDDMEDSAPFGESILRPVYRSHKQKELLEDAVIIYRIQRAPERRVFYIDVGKMPPQRVKMYLEQIKNEIKQKKIPSQLGGQNDIQSVYNPQSMCIALNTKIPLLDGRVLTLQEMIDEYEQGKQNWVYSINPETGEIVPGNVSWAGITRLQTEVVRITLDNNDQLICTPDHKIPTQNRGFIEAQDLKADDSLFPFTKREAPFAKNVVNIEHLPEPQDTGTLTIDKEERYHNFHTFALTSCFVRNSEDFFFACLSMKTTISLLDGRTLTLDQCRKEHEEGKENWVYSVNQETGKMMPGKIAWAGYTRRNAELVRVHLDNGEYIDSTPDHKFILRDGSEVEAQHLVHDTHLMFLHRDNEEYIPNHTVIQVERLSYREDTGCLHVVEPTENHNFALAVGVYVKNSRPDGRGSKVETLPGGAGLGELSELEYFIKKVWRGLRVPLSYMLEGQDNALMNDGKVGVAYIQELRFALFIMRLQAHIENVLDGEFKKFLQLAGILIDNSSYRLRMPPPTNFGKYRQQELDAQLLTTYASADGVPYMGKRYIMKRYLQMSDEEILINERLLREERGMDPDGGAEDYPTIYGGGGGEPGLGGALGGGDFGGGGPLTGPAGLPEAGLGGEELGGTEAGMEAEGEAPGPPAG